MSAQALVSQLRFARSKFLLGLEGLSAEDALQRVGHANSISWMVGHLASFEQLTHCECAQGVTVAEAVKVCDFGKPACTPDFKEMLDSWHAVTATADKFLDTLTDADLDNKINFPDGRPFWENIGTMIQRHTWHYWYHLGELQGIRQSLGHENLPQFVGRIDGDAQYQARSHADS